MFKKYCDQIKMVCPFLAPDQLRVGGKYLGKPSDLLKNILVGNGIEKLTEYTSFSFEF